MPRYLATSLAVAAIIVAVWAAAALLWASAPQKRPAAPHPVSCSEGCRYA